VSKHGKIFTIAPGCSVLKSTADYILSLHEKNPLSLAGHIVFLPNNRAILKLEKIIKTQKSPIILPQFYALNDQERLILDFALYQHKGLSSKTLTPFLKKQLIHKLLCHIQKDLSFTQADVLSASLIPTLDELIRGGIPPEALIIGSASSPTASQGTSLLKKVYGEYLKTLSTLSLIDPLEARFNTFKSLGKALCQTEKNILIAGISQHQRDTFAFFDSVKNNPHTTFIIPLTQTINDPAQHLIQRLEVEPSALISSFQEKKNILKISTPNTFSEAKIIAHKVRNAFEQGIKSIGIVVPEEFFKQQLTQELKLHNIGVNDSTALLLKETPEGLFLLKILSFLQKPLWRHLFTVLKNPFINASWVFSFEKNLRKSPLTSLDVQWDLLRNDPQALLLKELKESLQSLPQFLTCLEKTIGEFSPSFFDNDAGQSIHNLLKEIKENTFLFKGFSSYEFLLMMQSAICQQTLLRPRTPYTHEVNIIGMMEARLEDFELLIMTRLQEGVTPRTSPPNPWLSKALQKHLGFTSDEALLALQHQDFFLALQSAPEVILTHSHTTNNGDYTLPSRFLYEIESEIEDLSPITLEKLPSPLPDLATIAPPLHQGYGEPAIPDASIRPKKISITGFKTLLRNPYDFYAKYILKLKKLYSLSEISHSLLFGQILHKALDRAVRNKISFLPEEVDALLSVVKTTFTQEGFSLSPMQTRRVKDFCLWLCNNTHASFISSEVSLESLEGPITLYGTADRIDREHDEAINIIDYKTGTPPSQKSVALGLEPQLVLEALLYKDIQEIPTLTYINILPKAPFAEPVIIKKTEEILSLVKENLPLIFATYLNPEFTFYVNDDPRTSPNFSDYAHLARREVP